MTLTTHRDSYDPEQITKEQKQRSIKHSIKKTGKHPGKKWKLTSDHDLVCHLCEKRKYAEKDCERKIDENFKIHNLNIFLMFFQFFTSFTQHFSLTHWKQYHLRLSYTQLCCCDRGFVSKATKFISWWKRTVNHQIENFQKVRKQPMTNSLFSGY